MPFELVEDFEDNPLVEISELRFELSDEGDLKVKAELRIGLAEISLEESLYSIGTLKATLGVELEGFKPKIGSRWGDQNPLAATVSETNKQRTKRSSTLTGMLNGQGATGQAGFEASRGVENESFVSNELRHSGCKALPGNRWRFENANGKRTLIEATVLRGETLLALAPVPAANRYRLMLRLNCEKRDIEVRSTTPRRRVRQINRDRLIQLIATRSISNRQQQPRSNILGTICLSSSTQEYEIKDHD